MKELFMLLQLLWLTFVAVLCVLALGIIAEPFFFWFVPPAFIAWFYTPRVIGLLERKVDE